MHICITHMDLTQNLFLKPHIFKDKKLNKIKINKEISIDRGESCDGEYVSDILEHLTERSSV